MAAKTCSEVGGTVRQGGPLLSPYILGSPSRRVLFPNDAVMEDGLEKGSTELGVMVFASVLLLVRWLEKR